MIISANQYILVRHWPSRVHNCEHTVSHFGSISSLFSLRPRGYFLSRQETGSSFMQMTALLTGSLSLPHTSPRRGDTYEEKVESKSKSLLSTSCCLRCFCQTWQSAGWVRVVWLARFGFVSLSLSLSGSLFSLPLWTEARVLLGLLYCAAGKLPIRATLIEHWKQEFYKEADLLFITSHSLLFFFSHTLPFCTGSPCHTPTSFLGLFSGSIYTAFILPFSLLIPPPPLETPMVRLGYNVDFSIFFFFFPLCVWNRCWLVCR